MTKTIKDIMEKQIKEFNENGYINNMYANSVIINFEEKKFKVIDYLEEEVRKGNIKTINIVDDVKNILD